MFVCLCVRRYNRSILRSQLCRFTFRFRLFLLLNVYSLTVVVVVVEFSVVYNLLFSTPTSIARRRQRTRLLVTVGGDVDLVY